MIFNNEMEKILEKIQMDHIIPKAEYPIWQKCNQARQTFWGVGNFCGLQESVVESNYELTELEWDGNEIYICDSLDITELMMKALGIVKAWKVQMERNYEEIPFDIFLSVDEGDEEVSPSVTLRFWAVRNQEHYINPCMEEIEEFNQPVLMEQVNYKL